MSASTLRFWSALPRRIRPSLQRQIRDALNRFIPSVDWVFSTLHRGQPDRWLRADQRQSLCAHPQCAELRQPTVPDGPAREGLTLSGAVVDYSLRSAVNKVVHELRGEIVGTVCAGFKGFEQQTGRKWRIGDIEFGIGGRSDEYTAKGASRSSGYEDLLDPDGEGLKWCRRISLIADDLLCGRLL